MDIQAHLEQLASLQSAGNILYAPGLFPSQRRHLSLNLQREDDNIFYSALIAFTLQRLRPFLKDTENQVAESIIHKVLPNYASYANVRGEPTYNFWTTRAHGHFPYGKFMHRFRRFQLPDDADDTSLIYITSPRDNEQNLILKKKLEAHANLSRKQIKNTLPHYRALKAYNTWFGKKMPLDFDVCVMSNILYWVLQEQLPWTEQDEACLQIIESVLGRKEYLSHGKPMAPHYVYPAVILYHFARLAGTFEDARLNRLRQVLPNHLRLLYVQVDDLPQKLLLSNALWWMKQGNKEHLIPQYPASAFKDFYFFRAGILATNEDPFSRWLAPYSFFYLYYHCEAFHRCLYIEHLALYRSLDNAGSNV